MVDFDVVIAGAGPAGTAMALSLADSAPDLRVCLVDAPVRAQLRVGETLPPLIEPLLGHLGLWSRFLADGHCPSYRTVSSWGGPSLESNEFLLHSHQTGWRIDRCRFDATMREAAIDRVATSITAKVAAISHRSGAWHVLCGDRTAFSAHFAVDATGRAATVARLAGLRVVDIDRLVGCFVHVEGGADRGEGVMMEACADGWWYSVAVPGGRRVLAFMTDADLLGDLNLMQTDAFMQAVAATRHVRMTAVDVRPLAKPRLAPAMSRHLADETALPLLAVGDAASCFDPVSGQGIIKALRSGIFGSYAVIDWFNANSRGVGRFRTLVREEFDAYLGVLRSFYTREQRWRDRQFWKRRHRADGEALDRHTTSIPFLSVPGPRPEVSPSW